MGGERGIQVSCPFCWNDDEVVVIDQDLVYARFDRYSVSRGG